MNRRGFLGAILASAVAPAIVRADALMRIVPREASVVSIERGGFVMLGDVCEIEIPSVWMCSGLRALDSWNSAAMAELARRIDEDLFRSFTVVEAT